MVLERRTEVRYAARVKGFFRRGLPHPCDPHDFPDQRYLKAQRAKVTGQVRCAGRARNKVESYCTRLTHSR